MLSVSRSRIITKHISLSSFNSNVILKEVTKQRRCGPTCLEPKAVDFPLFNIYKQYHIMVLFFKERDSWPRDG